MENKIVFEGQIFDTPEALHEWRMAFDFEYFTDYSSQL